MTVLVKQRRVSRCRLGPKMKIRTFYVHSETREVHSVGKVQLVFSCKEAPIKDKPIALSKILMTNDTTLTAAVGLKQLKKTLREALPTEYRVPA